MLWYHWITILAETVTCRNSILTLMNCITVSCTSGHFCIIPQFMFSWIMLSTSFEYYFTNNVYLIMLWYQGIVILTEPWACRNRLTILINWFTVSSACDHFCIIPQLAFIKRTSTWLWYSMLPSISGLCRTKVFYHMSRSQCVFWW